MTNFDRVTLNREIAPHTYLCMTNNRLIDIPTSTANLADNGRIIDPHQVAQANDLVTQTGVLDLLTSWRTPHQRAGHERSTVADRVILVGLVLLEGERSSRSITTLAYLNQHRLAPESRELLCLPTPEANTGVETARWISRTGDAFHRMLDRMDPFLQKRGRAFTFTQTQAALDAHDRDREQTMKARLDEFTSAFLQMTFREQPQNLREGTISLAIDEMFVASPSRRGYSRHTLQKNVKKEATGRVNPARIVEVFGGWWHRGSAETPNKAWSVSRSVSPKWGWSACIAVVLDSEQPGAPRNLPLAIGATVSLPSTPPTDGALNVMSAALRTGMPAGVVHADKQYFAATPIHRLATPTADMGFTPSTDYYAKQLGVQAMAHGAECIEGTVYCPQMPRALKDASKDFRAGAIDRATYRVRIEARGQFQLEPVGRPDSHGRLRLKCPSTAHERADAPTLPQAEICARRSVTFDKDFDLRYRQAFAYGSPEWAAMFRHATHSSERLHAGIRDTRHSRRATGALSSVHGLAAAQLALTIVLTDRNLRTIAAAAARSEQPAPH